MEEKPVKLTSKKIIGNVMKTYSGRFPIELVRKKHDHI
jgi:hypothetical protein